MPIDGGVVVAYLAAYLLKGGRRIADIALESMMDRLVERVGARLGPRPLNTLEQDPADWRNQQLVAGKIDEAMRADQSLARELTQLVAELNRHGGQQFINEVYAQTNIQAWGGGPAVGGDLIYAPARHDSRITPESSAWVKVLGMLAPSCASAPSPSSGTRCSPTTARPAPRDRRTGSFKQARCSSPASS